MTSENASQSFDLESLICRDCTVVGTDQCNLPYSTWLSEPTGGRECLNCNMMRNAELAIETFSGEKVEDIIYTALWEHRLEFKAYSDQVHEVYNIYAQSGLILISHSVFISP
jgi:hypothetical protein